MLSKMEGKGLRMMYKRVPPVFSFEYLRVFLNVIDRDGYDRKAIRTAIFNERLKFEKVLAEHIVQGKSMAGNSVQETPEQIIERNSMKLFEGTGLNPFKKCTSTF